MGAEEEWECCILGIDPPNSVDPYWQQPDHSIMENHLVEVPEDNEVVPGAFRDFNRVFFPGDHCPFLSSLRLSSLHTFHQHNPMDGKNSCRDVVVRFWKDLEEGVELKDGIAMEGHDEGSIMVLEGGN
ncbi:hypothetical protein BDR04DRAFT_1121710 [Suillus decipiens]|nr:hypothetical protein BDR04DRAFT_1121710 [Suillus decipiens]